jgi:hypothetical protein
MNWIFLTALCSAATLDRSSVSAVGTEKAHVTVERFGRYSVEVSSPQGTALTLVDRMTGPGERHGRIGGEDGRIDAFLERGDYRVLVHSSEEGSGTATLTVTESRPADVPRRLQELKPVETTLGDHQHVGYWIELEADRNLAIEATGRHLDDLRFWHEGAWLVDAAPRCNTVEPLPGQPLGHCTLVTKLPAGLYLLAAYGGVGTAWAEEGPEKPLYLRWGVPSIGTAERRLVTLGPTGTNRYLVPKGPDRFWTSLPENAPFQLRVADHSSNPYSASGNTAQIDDETRFPIAELTRSGSGKKLMTVSGSPGQPFLMQVAEALDSHHALPVDADVFVGTLPFGDPRDQPPPTAMVVRTTKDKRKIVAASSAILLDNNAAYQERFNLVEPVTLYLEVPTGEQWLFETSGTMATVKVVPLLVAQGELDNPAAPRPTLSAKLQPGFYALQVAPIKPGIVELNIRADSWTNMAKDAIGMKAGRLVQRRPNVQFPSLELEKGEGSWSLWSAGPSQGVVVRELPINPANALPVSLMPGETLSLDTVIKDRGRLQVLREDGKTVAWTLDGEAFHHDTQVDPGRYQVRIRNDSEEAVFASLRLRPEGMDPQHKLPEVDEGELPIPVYPEIRASAPSFTDLTKKGQETWRLEVDTDGLYEVASSGLLDTSGNIRTRTRPQLANASAGGPGRNFEVGAYLRQGTYQVTARTQGSSEGHIGMHLKQAPVQQGGRLEDGAPARASVPGGHGLAYTFEVAEAASHALEVFGPGVTYQCRFEDMDGWPVGAPSEPCDWERHLEAGSYRVLVLPVALDTRRITQIRRTEQTKTTREGHGPHALTLGQGITHRWLEPGDPKGERTPDTWAFTLPAGAQMSFHLSNEMAATLFAGEEQLGRILPGHPLRKRLDAGDYRLEVRAARKDNRVDYDLRATAEELLVGQTRELSVPARIPVSLGARQLVELTSFGSVDVAARLKRKGRTIAQSDDRPDDWNFRISDRLEPGIYQLEIETLDGRRAQTNIRLAAPAEEEGPTLSLGEASELDVLGRRVALAVPLREDAELVTATATSGENIGLAIETLVDGGWRTLAEQTGKQVLVAARRPAGSSVRLRVWSLDQRGGPVTVHVSAPQPKALSESGLVSGAGLGRHGVAHLGARPGLFVLPGAERSLLVCTEAGAGCTPHRGGTVAVTEDGLSLVGSGSVQAKRVVVAPDKRGLARLTPKPTVADVRGHSGPTLVVARAPSGQPMLRFDDGWPAVASGRAAALSKEGGEQVRMWAGDSQPTEARLEAVFLDRPNRSPLSVGRTDGTLDAGAAWVHSIEQSHHELRLSLDAGMAARVGDHTYYADPEPLDVRLSAPLGDLLVVNAGTSEGLYSLELLPSSTQHDLADGPWEALPAHGGMVALDVPAAQVGPGHHDMLSAVGANELVYMRHDGTVARGSTVAVGGGGRALVQHGRAPVLVWAGPAPWPATDHGAGETITAPGRLSLGGPVAVLQLAFGGPQMAHMTADAPFIARVDVQGDTRFTSLPRGGSLDVWLPEGNGTVTLRAPSEAALWGELSITRSMALEAGEGLGPPTLLRPGSSRAYRFHIDEERRVGIGVWASSDRVTARLLDSQGKPKGEGLAQLHTLTAGDWILVLHQPGDGTPVRARPAVVGIEPPDTGPPDDVIRRYLELAANEASNGGAQ